MAKPDIRTKPTANMFWELLKMKRQSMKPAVRKRPIRIKGRWLYPYAVERKYAGKIKSILIQTVEPITNYILENIERWQSEFNFIMRDHFDVYPDDLQIRIEDIEKEIQKIYTEQGQEVRTMITDIGFDVSEQNLTQWGKFTKELIGVEFVPTESWETEVIKAWSNDNFTLIKSLSQEHIKTANTIVSNSLSRGETVNVIKRKIRNLSKTITGSRARLIARDQVGKLNGQYTQKRMTEAGIEMYSWLTAGDERVRGRPGGKFPNAIPSHWAMDGVICRWDDPTKFMENGKWRKRTAKMPKVHPGQEIQCRCTAVPYMDDIIEEVDRVIENEKAL
jgi:SPP1 gp7 family putative phage head morphogenesis protein